MKSFELKEGERVVDMCIFKERLYVATNLRVLRLRNDGKAFELILFVEPEEGTVLDART